MQLCNEYFEVKLYLIIVGPMDNSNTGTNVKILHVNLNKVEYEANNLVLGKYLSILQ